MKEKKIEELDKIDNTENLVNKYEKILFNVSMFFSVILWFIIIIGTLGVGLIYTIFGLMIAITIQAGFISYIKGNGVLVSKEQFPELDLMKKKIAESMGFTSYTSMYIVNMDGILNAFATRFLSRNFIILSANLLESCDDNEKLKFIVAHELAHLRRGHVFMQGVLLPSKIIPWLGKAYSKACEYTCDNYGVYYGTGNAEKAVKGLAVLSVGGKYSEKINIDAYIGQAKDSNGFWMSLYETKSTHPYLTKRVHNLMIKFGNSNVELPKRNIFGIILAPFFSIWFWIIVIYGIILISTMVSFFEKLDYKTILNPLADSNYSYLDEDENTEGDNDNYEDSYDYNDEEYTMLSEEKIKIFWNYYNRFNGDTGWVFSLYDKNITSEDYGTEAIYITKITNDGFYATYYDEEQYNSVNKKFLNNNLELTDFYMNTPYGSYDSISDMNSLEIAINNNK